MNETRRPGQWKRRVADGLAVFGLLSLVGLILLVGCSASSRITLEDPWMDYLDTLNRLQAEGSTLESESAAERSAVERFQHLLGDFKAHDFADRISEVYAEEAFFNDTLKTVRGVDEIELYLLASAAAIDEGRVEFLDWVESDGNYYFRWVMTLRFKRFAGGEPQRSVGMTHVRFDTEGKVVLHQDFWDSSAGFFEHLPFLGGLLRSVKRRI